MIAIKKTPVYGYRVAVARRHEHEPVVQNGLGITPSAMMELMQKGQPISSQAYALTTDTLAQANDFFVPAEHTKHFDIVDAWEAKMNVQEKVRSVRRKIKNGEITPQATEE